MKTKISLAILIFCLSTASSLKCRKCLSREGNCSETDVEVCSPSQDACFLEIKNFTALSADTVKQGCGTLNQCQSYRDVYNGSLYRGMYCCTSDLCKPVNYTVNRKGSKNGVKCQSCIGSIAECGLKVPSEPCYGSMNYCVQISQRFLPGEELEPIIKGCGDISLTVTTVEYQIGKDFAYVDQALCGLSNCNDGFTEITPGDPNGLQCYTCRDSGHGECARDRLQLLNCMGFMDQCVHVINNANRELPVTIQKGCATESMCTTYLDIYRPLMRQDSYAECCNTPLCNRAESPSAPEMLMMGTALVSWLALIARGHV